MGKHPREDKGQQHGQREGKQDTVEENGLTGHLCAVTIDDGGKIVDVVFDAPLPYNRLC